MSSNEQSGPSGVKPDSTLARDFSQQLDGVFNLDKNLEDLSQTVNEKKQTISSRSKELEELEARIQATESALKKAGVAPPPVPGAQQQRKDVREVFTEQGNTHSSSDTGTTGAPTMSPFQRQLAGAQALADRVPTPLDPTNPRTK